MSKISRMMHRSSSKKAYKRYCKMHSATNERLPESDRRRRLTFNEWLEAMERTRAMISAKKADDNDMSLEWDE